MILLLAKIQELLVVQGTLGLPLVLVHLYYFLLHLNLQVQQKCQGELQPQHQHQLKVPPRQELIQRLAVLLGLIQRHVRQILGLDQVVQTQEQIRVEGHLKILQQKDEQVALQGKERGLVLPNSIEAQWHCLYFLPIPSFLDEDQQDIGIHQEQRGAYSIYFQWL